MDIDLDDGLVHEFVEESRDLLEKCRSALTQFADKGEPKFFEEFGLYIDRIMGASFTMGFNQIGELSKLGKQIGYKTSQVEDIDKLLTSQSLLSQLIKEIEKILKAIYLKSMESLDDGSVLLARLKKANEGLGDLRASVKI